MKLVLILAGPYSSCENTQQIWNMECLKYHIELDVISLEDENGQGLAKQLNLKSFPALIVDTTVIAVGHPDKHTAERIIADLRMARKEI
ncbi:hypothetical protein [Sulfuriflexus mobilis]|uniref:hypothetical protein n=1 Tax=Sulfuriflexus mobilis TaxID=1811807 RepID=UPI000F8434D3|nr:hypothetical protein [Sulfuriflexus mobilis]